MRMASAFFFLLFFYSTGNLCAQNKVLDAAFILEKEHFFSPEPTSLNHLENNYFDVRIIHYPEMFRYITGEQLLFKSSYIYMEPQYYMVKVFRSFLIKDNPHFSRDVPKSFFEINPDSTEYIVYNSYRKENILRTEKKNALYFRLPRDLQRQIGLNIHDIKNEAVKYSYRKRQLSNLEYMLDMGLELKYVHIDTTGVLRRRQDLCVDRFSTSPFVELIIRAVLEGNATAYAKSDFNWPMTRNETIAIIDSTFDPPNKPGTYSGPNIELSDEILNQIKGIRIKEYWHIDPLDGELMSSIMGIGLIGEDPSIGQELFWFYYPELRYSLHYNYTYFRDSLYDYEYLLDQHLFEGELEEYHQGYSYVREKTDGHFAVKLDPMISIQMHKDESVYEQNKTENTKVSYPAKNGLKKLELSYRNGLANGKIREFWENGNTSFEGKMSNGLCEGTFKFYYKDGKLKGERNYQKGLLQGEQVNYYQSESQVYMRYSTEFDENTKLERYYEDGELMEKGSFDRGLQIDKWEYNIRMEPVIAKFLKEHYLTLKEFPVEFGENYIKYNVLYYEEEEYKEWCIPTFYRGRSVDRCMSRKIVE